MPDNQHRNDEKFAIYDAMRTEELQQILREDASKPVGEESDTDALVYIMEVLAKRRKERNEGKSPAEALESFKEKYYEEENENSLIPESVPVARKQSSGSRWRRGLVAVAAMLVLIVGSTITASALGFDLWNIIAKWTQETFHFGYAGQTQDTNAPGTSDSTPFTGLEEALDQLSIQVPLTPSWIPDGYVETDVRITDSPIQRILRANYECGENVIVIRIADYLDSYPMQIEQSDSLLEVYISNDIEYYIFDNFDQLKAVWINENFECYIAGPISVSEIKAMIDSIEKG